MSWFFLALISVFSISIANLIQKNLMKDKEADPYAYTIIFALISMFITGLFTLTKGFNTPPIQKLYVNFMVSATLYGLGSVLVFRALKTVDASENAIVFPLGTLVTILTAVFFLQEQFSLTKIAGALLVLTPIFLLNSNGLSFKFSKGFLYAALSAIFFGIAVTNDTFILKSYDAISYTPVIFLLPALVLIILKPSSVTTVIKTTFSSKIRNILIYSFFYSIQAITYYLALEKGPGASTVASIFKAETILTVILATIFLKERKNLQIKIVGAILATTGVWLLR